MKGEKIYNQTFGELIYKYSWNKIENVRLWDSLYEVNVKVEAYSDEIITKEQEDAYMNFKDNLQEISTKSLEAIKLYLNGTEFSVKQIKPRTILFKQDGSYGILVDYDYDDHGIVVIITKDYWVGVQDAFL